MVNVWRCRESTLVPGWGIVRPGQVLEFEKDGEPAEVRNNFDCLTSDQVKAEEKKKVEDNDLTFAAKVEKLKDMKVKIPRGCNKAQIDELFKEFVTKVELPDIVG